MPNPLEELEARTDSQRPSGPGAVTQADAPNPLSGLLGRVDAARTGRDPGAAFDRALGIATELEVPMATVEAFEDLIFPEVDFYGVKFPARKAGSVSGPVDPSDPFAAGAEDVVDARIGLGEQIRRMDGIDVLKRVPFSPMGAIDAIDLAAAARRLQKNEYEEMDERPPYSEARSLAATARKAGHGGLPTGAEMQARDRERLEQWILDRIEVADRGRTFGAKAFDGLSYLPGWMIEFSLTGGLASLGSGTAKAAVLKTLQGYAKTAGGRAALTAAGWAGGAITRATLGLPHRVAEEIALRRVQAVRLGPDGEVSVPVASESWASSILKGWGSVVIEAGSESAGQEIFKPIGRLTAQTIKTNRFGSRLYDALRQKWLFRHPEAGAGKVFADRFFSRAGFDGLLEEFGEEELAIVLEGLAGTEDFGAGDESGPWDRIVAGLNESLRPENLGVTMTVLAVPGAARAGLGMALDAGLTNAVREPQTVRQEESDELREGQETQPHGPVGVQTPSGGQIEPPAAAGATEPPAGAAVTSDESRATGDAFQGPQFFSYEDYAQRLPADLKELRRLARELGIQVSGLDPDSAAKFVGGALEDLTAGPEPAPLIEGEPHPGSLPYRAFFERYGQVLQDAQKPENAAWLARYGLEHERGVRGLHRALMQDWQRVRAWELFYELTGQERPAASAGAEGDRIDPIDRMDAGTSDVPAPDWPRTENEAREIENENAAAEAAGAVREFFGRAEPADLPAVTPPPPGFDAGFIGRILHRFGIKSLDGYSPISSKDLSRIWEYVQLPFDIARTFRQFAPVYGVQRARELGKQVLDRAFATKLQPYFDLTNADRKAVDELLVAQEQSGGDPQAIAPLLAGLSKEQYAAYSAVRDQLDHAARMLVERMKELGVAEERIAEFEARIGSYIPHQWYGPWAVVVREKGPDNVTRTTYMSAVRTPSRFTERDRLKAMFPGAKVDVIRRTKIDYEAFQDAPSWAVSRMLDLVKEQAEASAAKTGRAVDDQTVGLLRQAFSDLYKSKGFGMHFIKRAETPGWTGDLRRPLAEYFAGFSGFLTKMEAAFAFTEALEGIDPKRTPNLYKYASRYIRYVMGDEFEFGDVKKVLYYWYLYGNAKSAAVNLTGNLMLGWPALSKVTRWSLPKLLVSMADRATGRLSEAERGFLVELEAKGFLEAKLAAEISARGGNALLRQIAGPVGRAARFADFFRHAERLNRESMAVALFRAGVTDAERAAGIIEEAHFHYAKGNRPALARGPLSIVTVFRSFTLNQITWIKNQIKAGEYGALERHMLAWVLTGGVMALPLADWMRAAYVKAFGRDPEEDAKDLMGDFLGETLMRGLPPQAGISLTGSVAMRDLVPELDPDGDLQYQVLDWLGGVVSDIPGRANRVWTDLENRQYARALEDFAPEGLRNPMAAWRLYSEGATTRRGSPLIDWDTGEQMGLDAVEAALKAAGFQPEAMARGYDKRRLFELLEADRTAIKQQWVDRFYLAAKIKDWESMQEVLTERAQHAASMRERRRPRQAIPEKELAEAIERRLKPANMPSTPELGRYLELYKPQPKMKE